MERKEELKKLISVNSELVEPLIEEVIFMETQLDTYRSLPHIKVNPDNPMQQRATPAAKLYKETLQQYTNAIKVLAKATGQDALEEESPLRQWASKYLSKKE